MAGRRSCPPIIFVTAKRAVAVSAAFVAGVAVAVTIGTAIAMAVANELSLGDSSTRGPRVP